MRGVWTALVALCFVCQAQAQSRMQTAWGDPDLQGIWSNATITPLERPDAQAGKTNLTEAEADEANRTRQERLLKPLQIEVNLSGELNDSFLELGPVVRSRRTSLVVDPPDGKVPYGEEGKKRRDLANRRAFNLVPVDSWEDRTLAERCIATEGLFVPNPFYLNNHHIVQSRTHIAILSEVMHAVRLIALDGRPMPSARIGQWLGLSRGRFEGQTLVVDTSHFNDTGLFRAATSQLQLVERFTRVDADTIDYELTATDPATFTRPWTLANTLRKTKGPLVEYSCHEGNYGMSMILAGARARDRAREAKQP
jgi:hypothetical protein